MYDKIQCFRDKDQIFGGIFIRRGIPQLGVADSRVHRLIETITY